MIRLTQLITYIEYLAGKNKGATTQGDLFNSPFKLGNVDPTYTADRVVEAAASGTGAQALAWTPIVHGAINYNNVDYDVKLVKAGASDIYGFYKDADQKFYEDAAYTTQINVAADTKVAYVYDNIVVPQNDLPTLKAEMKSIPLIARARRIAVNSYAA